MYTDVDCSTFKTRGRCSLISDFRVEMRMFGSWALDVTMKIRMETPSKCHLGFFIFLASFREIVSYEGITTLCLSYCTLGLSNEFDIEGLKRSPGPFLLIFLMLTVCHHILTHIYVHSLQHIQPCQSKFDARNKM